MIKPIKKPNAALNLDKMIKARTGGERVARGGKVAVDKHGVKSNIPTIKSGDMAVRDDRSGPKHSNTEGLKKQADKRAKLSETVMGKLTNKTKGVRTPLKRK